MKVYLVIEHQGQDNGASIVLGIFTSREAAQAALDKLPHNVQQDNVGIGGGFEIEAWPLDRAIYTPWERDDDETGYR